VTATAETSSPGDLLKLQACPQCNYSLEGSPDEGICPECGRAYDRSIIILRCDGPGEVRMSVYIVGGIAIIGGAATMMALGFFPTFLRAAPQMFLMLAFLIAMLGLGWIDRLTSPRAGAWLLWIAPAGMGVQTEFDPDSLLARARRWLPLIVWPLYMFGAMVPMIFVPGLWKIAVPLGLAMSVGMVFVERATRVKPAVPASGVQPALHAWKSLHRIEMSEFKPGRYRIRATNDSWIARRRRVIEATLECTTELALQLRQRIAQLSGRAVVTPK
jgi:hypothetical protein